MKTKTAEDENNGLKERCEMLESKLREVSVELGKAQDAMKALQDKWDNDRQISYMRGYVHALRYMLSLEHGKEDKDGMYEEGYESYF